MVKLFEGDSPTIEEIRKLRKPRTHTVGLPMDSDVLTRIEELEKELRLAVRLDANQNREPEAPAIEAELEALRAEAEDSVVEFTFQEIPRKQYRALLDAFPDPDGKRRADDETIAPHLIAACCIDPEMTLDDAQAIWDEWSDVAASTLYGAAIMVNEALTRVPFGVSATAKIPGSEPNSTTAPSEGSDTATS